MARPNTMADSPPPPPAAAPAGVKGETRIEEPTPRQRTIARRVAEARATVPDLELSAEIDVGAAVALATRRDCSLTAILLRACALALREQPRINGAYRDGHFEFYSRINIGLTASTDDAFLVPVVFDADRKSLDELSTEIAVLRGRAAGGQLSPPELAGATFTVTDLGEHEVSSASTVLTPSQAAALAAGAVREIAAIRGADVVPANVLTITLACDHRIIYQSQAGAFLTRIKHLLQRASL